ncbi:MULTISPECIES: molybdate ABC transporter substrate-binding protein [unclassified Adlercreutzia]|uniref:molybdate ABC transporter substrate-binding protein n=1 Tax=unclassified Adlercreutzia TaxID=2636013 RepID=UPI0013EB8CBB|nr:MULTISPECIES: extracellular solute-binding protein [unclassified Adlercreutzia]
MKKLRVMLATGCAVAMVGSFALFGCSSNEAAEEQPASNQAAEQTAAEPTEQVELQVFAANSLKKAMPEAMALYTEAHPEVTFADAQYLSSGDLNAELEGGAYADILISASKAKMQDAIDADLADGDTMSTMFMNDLVIVAAEGSELAEQYGADQNFTLEQAGSGDYTVAIGDDSVPAGNYANQALSTIGSFNAADGKTGADTNGKAGDADGYADTPLAGKVNLQAKVGDVAAQVSSGSVDLGFVYTSDVYSNDGLVVIGVVPADTHKDIVYPGAVTTQSEHVDAAKAFMEWCATDPAAIAVWQEWGFALA